VYAGDITGDGIEDALAYDYGGLRVLSEPTLATIDAASLPSITNSTTAYPYPRADGDYDGDGIGDVLPWGGGYVGLLYGPVEGALSSTTIAGLGEGKYPGFADIDGDGATFPTLGSVEGTADLLLQHPAWEYTGCSPTPDLASDHTHREPRLARAWRVSTTTACRSRPRAMTVAPGGGPRLPGACPPARATRKATSAMVGIASRLRRSLFRR
jgi:hypothetical protein